ncbi:hypothetical protein BM607_003410 [Shewanella sp. SACH]|uniref:hypothetical protein n=1 Tax=Shewanella sp. SACH TaxID=1873135 RepID=UPI0009041042|nr:hypothetical protein [Shewanella sp. SACH]OUS52993.1 hypothetical protein BM607_003410 [Shewanella sp. SACH]
MAFETISLGTQPAGTGGDTARTAFEKVNRNFIAADVLAAAMSQAQFEAIRAQNNEEFAASGFVHFGKHTDLLASRIVVNEGLFTDLLTSNILGVGYPLNSSQRGKSKTDAPVLNVAGVIFNIYALNSFDAWNKIKLPQAPDGKVTYNKTTGVVTTHATVTAAFNAQAADQTNVEVVTDRVDMWGFEAWLEEVNTTNPYVYPNGLIQSQATTMDGTATSASARPVTYYAVFYGDTGSKGKGLNYFALSDANKKKVLANSKNNLYYLDDGRLVQWRLRQRSFAGAGNGDWTSISPVTDQYGVRFSATNDAIPQGSLNTTSNRQPTQYFYSSKNPPSNIIDARFYNDAGVYQIRPTSADLCGINGQCYFLVCGTVNRLNQGAYHPSFNPSGTASWTSAQQPYLACTWDNKDARTKLSGEPTNTAGCFTGALGTSNGGFGNIGTKSYDGYNHPDKRFYDAIYAEGQGGVCRDMRYSANGVDLVDFAEADQKVKNGTYRGFEKLKFTLITKTTGAAGSWDYLPRLPSNFIREASIGDIIYVQTQSGTYEKRTVISKDASNIRINAAVDYALDYICILETTKSLSVGGSFLQTDVIGNPANILATPQLVNGWQGSWLPIIPDGVKKYSDFFFTRKVIQTSPLSSVSTDNNGTSWVTGAPPVNSVINSVSSPTVFPANRVQLLPYQAFAKQTENAVNGVVYGGEKGIGSVWEYSGFYPHTWGNALLESLLGKVGVSADSNLFIGNLALIYSMLRLTGEQDASSVRLPIHNSINLSAPTNSSSGVKAINYNVNLNQQAFIQYAYTELKHNGTNWGDDGKVTIVDNQTTKTDLNGNTVLVGTAKLKEPIGWIKNKV